ncbi:hypothetical protein BJ322DRAFT_1210647 [Thelephora terrestris]|uniref:Uncharacterized protein n=1 Tax=Thelephora terrestris TaxID=56493 RepID=A0A9P6L6Z8_9AGAM|nr:hypothetical protein BJ322DRAFT_1210647 [Thelephora terrestris]
MQICDSDTESEPESDLKKWDATEFASQLPHVISEHSDRNLVERVTDAITTLESIPVGEVLMSERLHGSIEGAASAIFVFLNEFSAPELSMGVGQVLKALSLIANESFMSLLFEYRTIFRTLAARQVPVGRSPSSVICWVDVVLYRISALVDHPDCILAHLPSLQKQREDDMLRAATQLPGSWLEAAGWFASEDASPAACRMSLRLAFVVYALCATGSRKDEPSEKARLIMQSALDGYIQRLPSPTQEDSGELSPLSRTQARLTHAMILSLLGVIETDASLQFRPHRAAILMRHVQSIFHPSSTASEISRILPLAELDVPQRILVSFGKTIFWAWTQWNDGRILGIESILIWTATWIHQLPSEDNSEWDNEVCDALDIWRVPFSAVLMVNSHPLILIFIELDDVQMTLRRYVELINVSTMLAQEITELFRRPVTLANRLLRFCCESPVPCHTEMKRCLVEAYPFIDDVEGGSLCTVSMSCLMLPNKGLVLDLIVEVISNTENRMLAAILDTITQDTRSNFVMKLALVISSSANEALGGDKPAIERIRRLLMFLTVLWQAGAMGTGLPQIITSFVSSLGKKFAARDPNVRTLGGDILNALTALEVSVPGSLGKDRDLGCADMWLASLDSDPENLLDASAFANFVAVSLGSRKRDALLESETWDYLRDSLLLILTRHYFCDEEPIALAAAPSACFAMTCLFCAAAPQARSYMLNSPWTMNMCALLKATLGDIDEKDQFAVVLKDRLKNRGAELLDQIAQAVHAEGSPSTSSGTKKPKRDERTRLIFCKRGGSPPSLLSVPYC